jgi:hypothetical protein
MKKRYVVQRVRLVPEDKKDYLGRPVEQIEETTYLRMFPLIEELERDPYQIDLVKREWTVFSKEIRYFRTEELAEKAAFAVVVGGLGKYMGHVSVVRVPGRVDLIKVRRRKPEKVNVGRWPHSDGRKRREAQEKH